MRSACFVVLISAVLVSAEINPKFGYYSEEGSQEVPLKISDSEEFQNVVDYLNENASGSDIVDLIECLDEALDDMGIEDRSFSSAVQEIFHEIPWNKIDQYVQGKLAGHQKFEKVYAMLKDPKFQDLLNKAVSSDALKSYAKSVEANGFTWSAFVSFALKAICETAIVSHHDVYSEGVCKALKNL